MVVIFHCSTCDPSNKNSPLCIKGESFRFNDEIQDFEDLGSCRCLCHKGSAHANKTHDPEQGGPGAYGDPNDNGEGIEGILRDKAKAESETRELVSI